MKICNWCDQVIRPDEEYTEVDKVSPSCAGATLYRHALPCRPVRVQTSPSRAWR